MAALSYLFFTKIKASIRNIFSKWTSAILTLVALAFFVFFVVLILNQKEAISMMSPDIGIEGWLSMFSGYALFLLGVMVAQKRTAMVMKNDAHYIFAGPFSRGQTLGYLLIETVKGSILYALMAVAYLLFMMGAHFNITSGFILILVISSSAMFYFVFAMITYFYFLEMIYPFARKVKIGLLVVVLVYIGALVGINIVNHGMDISLGFSSFISDSLFNYIPVFGWVKFGLLGFVQQKWLACLLGVGGTVGICAILTYLIINVKGDFYEQAINDAEWVTELRNKAKLGQNNANSLNEKVKAVNNASFSKGSRAIFSKNLLMMRKTKTWLRKQDIFLVLFYMLIAYFSKFGFSGYQYMVLIIIFMSSTNDMVRSELRSHYIYLIPDKPLKKLIYLIMPSLLRSLILVLLAIVPCILLFQVPILDILFVILNLMGYVCVFVAGELWCLRIMKSRSNVIVEQFLKMLIIVVAVIPALAISVILGISVGFNNPNLIVYSTLASVVCNLAVGIFFILMAKSILRGNNIMAD